MDRAIRNMILQINAGNPCQGVPPFQRRGSSSATLRQVQAEPSSFLAHIHKTWLRLGSVMVACKNFPLDFFNEASHERASSIIGAAAG